MALPSNILDGFRIYCGYATLEEWVSKVRSTVEVPDIARKVLVELCSARRVQRLRRLPPKNRDVPLENICLFNRNALLFWKHKYTVKRGDVGAILNICTHWLCNLFTSLPSSQSGLKEPSLINFQAFIDGKWLDAKSGDKIVVTSTCFSHHHLVQEDSDDPLSLSDPATNEELERIPDMGLSETKEAIDATAKAFTTWKDHREGRTMAVNGKIQTTLPLSLSDPATNEELGTIPDMGLSETKEAIDAAAKAFTTWKDDLTHLCEIKGIVPPGFSTNERQALSAADRAHIPLFRPSGL